MTGTGAASDAASSESVIGGTGGSGIGCSNCACNAAACVRCIWRRTTLACQGRMRLQLRHSPSEEKCAKEARQTRAKVGAMEEEQCLHLGALCGPLE